MLIKKTSIQNLCDSISLPEHLKQYLELKRSGSNWLGLCPFHQDSTPSFYVYPTNYHCFACQAHGNVLDYELHRTSMPFKDCVERLASSYGFSLEYESTEFDAKKNKRLQSQAEEIDFLKKIKGFLETKSLPLFNQWTEIEKKLFRSFSFSSDEFRENLFSPSNFHNYHFKDLLRENGTLYGFFFHQKANVIVSQSQEIPWVEKNPYFTISKNVLPCVNWNESRPFAIKEKQVIVVSDYDDLEIFHQKGLHNIVVCVREINSFLFKLFSKRLKNILLILPEGRIGQTILWETFRNAVDFEDMVVDVLFVHENQKIKADFLNSMSKERIGIWFKNAEKIHMKISEIFLDSIKNENNKKEKFKEKILPIIQKIKDTSTKNAILADISNKYFSSNITLPYQSIPKNIERSVIATTHQQAKISPISLKQGENESEHKELISRTAEFYHKYLLKLPRNTSEVHGYLADRGLSNSDIQMWKIGYCSSENHLSKKAQSRLVSEDNLSFLGIIKRTKSGSHFYDFFHDRMIIPILNHQGEIVALSGRILPSAQKAFVGNSPKYINSPESDIFSKSKILFNYYRSLEAIITHKYVIVVEGYMDCISLVKAGIENVVAVMGTALTKSHLQDLTKITSRILICFDNDKAGQNAAKRTFASAVEFPNLELEYLVLPDCKDPDEYIKRFGKDCFLTLTKEKNTLLYEKICQWCQGEATGYQEFIQALQREFVCVIESENDILGKQIETYIQDKYNFSMRDFFNKNKPLRTAEKSNEISREQSMIELDFDWSVRNPLEMRLLFGLVHLKFSQLPQCLQNILNGENGEDENAEKICALALEQQLSRTGFKVFLELSSWMHENQHISLLSVASDVFESFSKESQILFGFVLSEIKILMRFQMHEFAKDCLSDKISMVLSKNVWNLKNAGFLKFCLRNIKLAFQNEVLQSLFAETLLNLEVDYIDDTLKARSSLHFDNDLDEQFQFLVSQRVRCKTELGSLN